MGDGLKRAAVATLIAACACATLAAPALAGDRNSVPPKIELVSGGVEGLVGPRSEALASFWTGEGGTRTGYTKDSKIRFTCSVDGRRVKCPHEYIGYIAFRHGRKRELPGSFGGWVPVPKGLAQGPHTVTVQASDEDGTEAEPPSVAVFMDRTRPSAPVLTQKPLRRSRDHKPEFRFSASDDVRLVRSRGEQFTAALRRLKPPGVVYRSYAFGGSFLSVWFPTCPTLLTCSTRAEAAYEASEGWYSYGEPEWLIPGVYELRVRARDAVGNKSPLSTYRFRILRGRAR